MALTVNEQSWSQEVQKRSSKFEFLVVTIIVEFKVKQRNSLVIPVRSTITRFPNSRVSMGRYARICQ